MDFAAVVLGGQAVAELVDDLDDGQAEPEAQDRPPVEEVLKIGQLVIERLPLADDQ